MFKIRVALLLFALSSKAMACSCAWIASIGEEIEFRPVLVQAQVTQLDVSDDPPDRKWVRGARMKVISVLKGKVPDSEIYVEQLVCYASVTPSDMKVGQVFILPLDGKDGHYGLGGCAHTGLELIDGKLYTYEPAKEGGRERRFYMTHSEFLEKLRNNTLPKPSPVVPKCGDVPPHVFCKQ